MDIVNYRHSGFDDEAIDVNYADNIFSKKEKKLNEKMKEINATSRLIDKGNTNSSNDSKYISNRLNKYYKSSSFREPSDEDHDTKCCKSLDKKKKVMLSSIILSIIFTTILVVCLVILFAPESDAKEDKGKKSEPTKKQDQVHKETIPKDAIVGVEKNEDHLNGHTGEKDAIPKKPQLGKEGEAHHSNPPNNSETVGDHSTAPKDQSTHKPGTPSGQEESGKPQKPSKPIKRSVRSVPESDSSKDKPAKVVTPVNSPSVQTTTKPSVDKKNTGTQPVQKPSEEQANKTREPVNKPIEKQVKAIPNPANKGSGEKGSTTSKPADKLADEQVNRTPKPVGNPSSGNGNKNPKPAGNPNDKKNTSIKPVNPGVPTDNKPTGSEENKDSKPATTTVQTNNKPTVSQEKKIPEPVKPTVQAKNKPSDEGAKRTVKGRGREGVSSFTDTSPPPGPSNLMTGNNGKPLVRKHKYDLKKDPEKYQMGLHEVFNPKHDNSEYDDNPKYHIKHGDIYDVKWDEFVYKKTYGNSFKQKKPFKFTYIEMDPNTVTSQVTKVRLGYNSRYYHSANRLNQINKVKYSNGVTLVEDTKNLEYLTLLEEDFPKLKLLTIVATENPKKGVDVNNKKRSYIQYKFRKGPDGQVQGIIVTEDVMDTMVKLVNSRFN